ncbi:MAG: hypothetical protein IKY94_11875 [Lachnospiraceae bacterium]|nr:hypothetical protein [Lachnospiraceae bacterium]
MNLDIISKKKGKQLKIVYSILIIICILYKIIYARGTTYGFADEVGYWGTAATFAGYDWSGVMSNISYYSFIYAFLLTPILKLNIQPIGAYQLGLLLNLLMLVVVFYISCYVMETMLNEIPNYLIITACFTATLYPAYIFYSQNTSGEILYLLLYWIAIYTLIQYISNSSTINVILFIVVIVLNFAAHMRSISILLAGIGAIIIINMLKKKKSHLLIMLVTIPVLLYIFFVYKNHIQDRIYLQNEFISHNDISGQISRSAIFFTVEGIKSIINMILGRMFYLTNATLFLIVLGVIVVGVSLIYTKIDNRNILIKRKYTIVALFMIVSTIMSICVSAAFVQSPGNHIHYLYYGRYTEYTIMPLIILGLLSFKGLYEEKKYFLIAIIDIITCRYLYLYMKKNGVESDAVHPNTSGTAGILSFVDNIGECEKATFLLVLITLVIICMCVLIRNIRKKVLSHVVIMWLIASIWMLASYKYIGLSIHSEEILGLHQEYEETAKIIKENNVNKNDVAMIYDGNWRGARISHYLQFKIPNINLYHLLTSDDLVLIKENNEFKYLILGTYLMNETNLINNIENEYSIIYSNNQLRIYERMKEK